MLTLTIHEDESSRTYPCANGFVARVVSAVHDENHEDAARVCEILNAYFAKTEESCHERLTKSAPDYTTQNEIDYAAQNELSELNAYLAKTEIVPSEA